MATGDKRQSAPPVRLAYSGLGQQSEEQRSAGILNQIKEEPTASTSGVINAPPPQVAVDRKSKSSHSSSSSRLRQVDLKMKREIANLTNEYEDKKFALEDKFADLKRKLEATTDDDEVSRIEIHLSDLEVEIPRLKRDFQARLKRIRETAELDKEEIQIEIDEEQYFDIADVGEPVDNDVENWVNTQATTGPEEPVAPLTGNQDVTPQAPQADQQYHASANYESSTLKLQPPPSQHSHPHGRQDMLSEQINQEEHLRSTLPPPPPLMYYDNQFYQNNPPPRHNISHLNRQLPLPPSYQPERTGRKHEESGNAVIDLAKAMKDVFQDLKGDREWEPRDLPTFNGRAEDWPIFINEFHRTTPSGKVNSSQNAIRLRKALKGVAKDAVIGLLNEPKNVTRILSLLEDRFGRSELVISTLIKKAEDCKNVDPFKPETFVEFSTTVLHLVESVRSLNEDSYLNDRTLLNKLIMKLPLNFSSEWLDYLEAHSYAPKNLDTFGKWAERKMKKLVHLVNPVIREDREQRPKGTPGSASVHVAATEEFKEERRACPCCERSNHTLKNCFKFKKISVKDRGDLVRKSGYCFRCLEHGHIKRWKATRWRKATSNEATGSTHDDKEKDSDGGQLNIGAVNTASSKPLSIVQVKIRGEKGTRNAFALLDSGADTTVIEESLAKEVGLTGKKTRTTCKGVGGIKQCINGEEVDFEIAGAYRKAKFYNIKSAVTHPNLQLSPYSQDVKAVKEKWPYLQKAKLETFENVVPRIIIGEDHPYVTAHRQLLQRDEDDPMAKRTLLGWVIGGRNVGSLGGSANIHTLTTDDREYLDSLLKSQFSLESYGVYPINAEGSIEDHRALEILQTTTKKKGNLWECGLLWRDPNLQLPDSKPDALSRMFANEKRMKRDPVFSEMYHNKIEEYLRKGYIHELSPEEVNHTTTKTLYIPHFGVFNVNKPGKLRLVFDAANRTGNSSLNQHLLTGPDLIRPLPSVLMNFRKHNVVINGDIEDMFHRVSMKMEDRESQRFLFRDIRSEGNPVKTYTMDVLIFGACSSPASAIYVKNRNAEEFAEVYPEAVKAIQDDFYIDDCLTGAASAEEAINLCKQIRDINNAGNFAVKKWLSNDRKVIQSIPEEDRAAGLKGFGDKSEIPTERVLGLWYSAEEDVFTFSANYKKLDPTLLEGRRPSKREMCRVLMSVFDPLGFLANYKIKGLILLQQTWRSGIDWDEDISDFTYDYWKEWIHNLKETENVKIPRLYCYDIQISESVQLHTMVDASEEACSAICFLRIKQGESITVAFVNARTKVAPTKKLTIPRLELTAAVMGACLADKVQSELKISMRGRYFWSDSKTVLMWIRSETLRYKEFVANRINRIQMLSNVAEWKWVPTALNVADQGTRLNSKIEFSPESTWLTGPSFLKEEPNQWPQERKREFEEIDDNVSAEEKKVVVCSTKLVSENQEGSGRLVVLEKFSDFTRLIRAQSAFLIAARYWLGKFRKANYFEEPWKIVKDSNEGKRLKRTIVGTPNLPMLEKAENMIIKHVQQQAFGEDIQSLKAGRLAKGSKLIGLSPFMKDGILRVKGRITNADIPEDTKYPIILPAKHHFTELLILKEHQRNGHQGHATVLSNLRHRYWILEGRTAVTKAVEKCQFCHLRSAKPIIPKMGALPYYKLSIGQPAFTYTGVDLFGPLEVVVGRHREKRWVSVFTCMVTRAVHLEVVYGLSTDETIMAISRFVDQRGRPRHFFSDNGSNYVGTRKELHLNWEAFDWSRIQNLDKFREINWHFSPPCSPHFGGAWERMVQAVKKVLKKTMFEVFPKDQTLLTMLKGAECLINSRPLTYLSNDPSDPEPLTPNHFLRGFSDIGPNIPGEYEPADEVLRSQYRRSQYFLDLFWKRWTKEVLPELSRRDKWHVDSEPLGVGDIVLMVDDQCPRNVWRKGVIVEAFPGKDGQVRVVAVEVSDFVSKKKSVFRRGVDKVVPLGLKMEKSGRFA